MRSSSSAYTRRLIRVGACLAGGFTLVCVSGWMMVIQTRADDSGLLTLLRWVPVLAGVFIVVLGFYLLQAPIAENPTDFFQEFDGE